MWFLDQPSIKHLSWLTNAASDAHLSPYSGTALQAGLHRIHRVKQAAFSLGLFVCWAGATGALRNRNVGLGASGTVSRAGLCCGRDNGAQWGVGSTKPSDRIRGGPGRVQRPISGLRKSHAGAVLCGGGPYRLPASFLKKNGRNRTVFSQLNAAWAVQALPV